MYECDVKKAVANTKNIVIGAYIKLIEQLHKQYPIECYKYLSLIVLLHKNKDLIFNSVQFIFDNYEVSPQDRMEFATHLDKKSLEEIYYFEVFGFIESEFMHNLSAYSIYSDIDELSQDTTINEVEIPKIKFDISQPSRIDFSGNMKIDVSLFFDDELCDYRNLPGSFSGYFDESGIFIEETSIDTIELM